MINWLVKVVTSGKVSESTREMINWLVEVICSDEVDESR